MAFYENTIVAKQDLAEKELKTIKEKYNELINKSSGKVIKIEEWGFSVNPLSKIVSGVSELENQHKKIDS